MMTFEGSRLQQELSSNLPCPPVYTSGGNDGACQTGFSLPSELEDALEDGRGFFWLGYCSPD